MKPSLPPPSYPLGYIWSCETLGIARRKKTTNQPIIRSLLEEELSHKSLLLNRIGYPFFFVNNQIPRWYPVNNSVQTLGQNARNTLNNNTLTLQNEQSTTTYYNNLPKQPTLQQPTKTTYHNNLLVYYRPRDPTYTRELEAFFVSSRWGSIVISFHAME